MTLGIFPPAGPRSQAAAWRLRGVDPACSSTAPAHMPGAAHTLAQLRCPNPPPQMPYSSRVIRRALGGVMTVTGTLASRLEWDDSADETVHVHRATTGR